MIWLSLLTFIISFFVIKGIRKNLKNNKCLRTLVHEKDVKGGNLLFIVQGTRRTQLHLRQNTVYSSCTDLAYIAAITTNVNENNLTVYFESGRIPAIAKYFTEHGNFRVHNEVVGSYTYSTNMEQVLIDIRKEISLLIEEEKERYDSKEANLILDRIEVALKHKA